MHEQAIQFIKKTIIRNLCSKINGIIVNLVQVHGFID